MAARRRGVGGGGAADTIDVEGERGCCMRCEVSYVPVFGGCMANVLIVVYTVLYIVVYKHSEPLLSLRHSTHESSPIPAIPGILTPNSPH